MKAGLTFFSLAALALWLAYCTTSKPTTAASSDPDAPERAKYIERVKRDIAGQENLPADSVFLNVTVLKKIPAERLLTIMDHWGQALGVSCDHCHVNNEWASEVKPPKEIARQMIALTTGINKDIASIKAIKSDDPGVSCYTCHRGDVTPRRNPK